MQRHPQGEEQTNFQLQQVHIVVVAAPHRLGDQGVARRSLQGQQVEDSHKKEPPTEERRRQVAPGRRQGLVAVQHKVGWEYDSRQEHLVLRGDNSGTHLLEGAATRIQDSAGNR